MNDIQEALDDALSPPRAFSLFSQAPRDPASREAKLHFLRRFLENLDGFITVEEIRERMDDPE